MRESFGYHLLQSRSDEFMACLTAILCLVVVSSSAIADSVIVPGSFEIQGHRGARAKRPENTIAAFSYAIKAGADVLEMDLQVTRDGHLIVVHDPIVNTLICQGPGIDTNKPAPAYRAMTLKQVKALDCGSLRHPDFCDQIPVPGAKIPTFVEVAELVGKNAKSDAARRIRLNIELKSLPGRPELSMSPDKMAELVVDVLERHGLVDRVTIQSFDHRMLRAVHRIRPQIALAVLIGKSLPDLIAVARAANAQIVSPNHEWLTPEAVTECKKVGLRVIPYTVNAKNGWERLLKMGVDGIITDDPEGLRGFLMR